MRLAREYERAEGRDLRGFLAYAVQQDLAEAREGEAALESEGLDAVRLMTIHRAKGLEFPVVCVADLGRQGASGRERLLIGPDGGAGLRLATLAGGDPVPALGYEAIADGARRRRVGRGAAPALRRRHPRRGAADPLRRHRHREVAGAAPRRPAARLARTGAAGRPRRRARRARGRPADRPPTPPSGRRRPLRRGRDRRAARHRRDAPAEAAAPAPRDRTAAPGTALPAEPKVIPAGGRPQPAQRRLSYSSLQDYARCPYRFYLGPRARAAARRGAAARRRRGGARRSRRRWRAGSAARSSTSCSRSSTSPGPRRPTPTRCSRSPPATGWSWTPSRSRTSARQVAAFAASPLCARLAAARGVRREAGFAFALEPDGGGPLVNGFIDVLAREADGTVLVVDYKTDRLDEDDTPDALIERAYTIQRKVYALAALQEGAERVEVAYALTERPGRAGLRHVRARPTRPRWPTRCTTWRPACSPRQWPVAERPHRELCGECPGRATLCSWPETMTLRPPEEAYAESAGTLAGSGGPS